MSDFRPIAVFDSGVGGLTVLESLQKAFPNESFLYLGDTARLPYGTKSKETIRQYLSQNIDFLMKQQVKAIVVACNSASTVVDFDQIDNVPVYEVIRPGAQLAISQTQNQKVGVLGTRATIKSECYKSELQKLDSQVQVFSCACPLFVPFAEEGLADDPLTNLVVFRYLGEISQSGVDTVILGCTHYPILKLAISKVMGSAVSLVDSGESLAQLIAKDFESGRLKENTGVAKTQLMATDDNNNMDQLIKRFLPTQEGHQVQIVKI